MPWFRFTPCVLTALTLGPLGGVLLATTAAAGDAQWDAPAECPAPADWQETTGVQGIKEDVHVVVSHQDATWTARISAQSEGSVGTRELSGESCDALNQAVLVALSLIAGKTPVTAPVGTAPPVPSGVSEPSNATAPADSAAPAEASASAVATFPPPPVEPVTDAPAAPADTPQTQQPNTAPAAPVAPEAAAQPAHTEPPAEASRAWNITVAPAFLIAVDGTAAVSLGGGASAMWWLEPVSLGIAASGRAPPGGIDGQQNVHLDFELVTARVDACLYFAQWKLMLAACAGPMLQHLSARARGISDPQGDADWLGGISGALTAHSVELWNRIGVWGEARLEGRPQVPSFEVQPYGNVLDFPAWTLTVSVGPEIWF